MAIMWENEFIFLSHIFCLFFIPTRWETGCKESIWEDFKIAFFYNVMLQIKFNRNIFQKLPIFLKFYGRKYKFLNEYILIYNSSLIMKH